MRKEISLTLVLPLVLILIGCAEKPTLHDVLSEEELNQISVTSEEDQPNEEPLQEHNKSEAIEEPQTLTEVQPIDELLPPKKKDTVPAKETVDHTVLYIDGEDWKVLINLSGFEDKADSLDLEMPSRILYQAKELNDTTYMFISVFAEIVPNTNDSKSCRDYYDSKAHESIKPTYFWKRDEKAISSYYKSFQYEGEDFMNLHMNAFAHYNGYCFDFHLAKVPYLEESDLQEFYYIIDSIQLVDETISPHEAGRTRMINTIGI